MFFTPTTIQLAKLSVVVMAIQCFGNTIVAQVDNDLRDPVFAAIVVDDYHLDQRSEPFSNDFEGVWQCEVELEDGIMVLSVKLTRKTETILEGDFQLLSSEPGVHVSASEQNKLPVPYVFELSSKQTKAGAFMLLRKQPNDREFVSNMLMVESQLFFMAKVTGDELVVLVPSKDTFGSLRRSALSHQTLVVDFDGRRTIFPSEYLHSFITGKSAHVSALLDSVIDEDFFSSTLLTFKRRIYRHE